MISPIWAVIWPRPERYQSYQSKKAQNIAIHYFFFCSRVVSVSETISAAGVLGIEIRTDTNFVVDVSCDLCGLIYHTDRSK